MVGGLVPALVVVPILWLLLPDTFRVPPCRNAR